MAEYSRIAKGSFTSTGGAQAVILPFVPDYVEIFNYSVALAAPSANGVVSALWDSGMGQGYAVEQAYNATPVLVADAVTTAGISTFQGALALQFGPQKQVIGATAANPIVFNVTAHGYKVGDTVLFEGLYQTATTGMPQICGMPFIVSAVGGPNNFSVVYPGAGSNFTALSGSPAGAYVKKVLYPALYSPGVNFIEAIALGTTTTVTTTAANNFVVGQQIAFQVPLSYGTTQLNYLPNSVIPGSPVYGYVTSVTSATQFVCSINSTGFTAFNTNQTVASVPGLQFAQVWAVGDVNSGGTAYSGGALYPSPVVSGVSTINGPAIYGAFVNNTNQGFIVGAGAGTNLTSSVLVGANGNVIYWRAYLADYAAS
jgi:hypothetical protein